MNLIQAIQEDHDLVTLLVNTDSVSEVIEYCRNKGYGVSLDVIKETFKIPSSASVEDYMTFVHESIAEAVDKAETMDEDAELESVTGGFVVAIATAIAAAVATTAAAKGTEAGIDALKNRISERRAERQQM